jgi:hypothetical protein
MTIKKRVFSADGKWQDFRCDDYYELLKDTASTWVLLLENLPSSSEAYKRATLLLPQLPIEFGDNDKRFDRSRWRHENVVCEQPTTAHCEHPWTKKKTRKLVEDFFVAARENGMQKKDIVLGVGEILDSRQDTLLLPTMRTKDWGVINKRKADGLVKRYSKIADKLIDRKTGQRMSTMKLEEIEKERSDRISAVFSS